MAHHTAHTKQPSIGREVEYHHPLFTSPSDPEDNEIPDVQSFDEDDMYRSDIRDDTIITLPLSKNDLQTPSDGTILTLLESVDDVKTLLVGIVCHSPIKGIPDH